MAFPPKTQREQVMVLVTMVALALVAGDQATSARLIGSRTQQQEVEEEISAAQAILAREKEPAR